MTTDDGTDVFLAKASAEGEIQSVVILSTSAFDVDSIRTVYTNANGNMLLFGNLVKADGDIFFSSLDSNGKLSNCSLLISAAKPIKREFGALDTTTIHVTEGYGGITLTGAGLPIKSLPCRKKASHFCPDPG